MTEEKTVSRRFKPRRWKITKKPGQEGKSPSSAVTTKSMPAPKVKKGEVPAQPSVSSNLSFKRDKTEDFSQSPAAVAVGQKNSVQSQSQEGQEPSHSPLHEELKRALNDHLYLAAEFENFKRRAEEEKRQLRRYDGERFIASLADEVLDDLERALFLAQHKEPSFEDLKKGLVMIQKKLNQVLKKFGVEVLDPTGRPFDPSWQSALSSVKNKKVPAGSVVETFKKAYKLHDRLIRPAQVVLSEKNS